MRKGPLCDCGPESNTFLVLANSEIEGEAEDQKGHLRCGE